MIKKLERMLSRYLWKILVGYKVEVIQLDKSEDFIFVFEEDLSEAEYSTLHNHLAKMIKGELIVIGGGKPTIIGFAK